MKYFEYYVHCARLPDRKTVHAVVTHFFGSKELDNVNYRVLQEGKGIRIYTDCNIDNEFVIKLKNIQGREFECKLLRKVEHEQVEYKEGDEVTISGLIAYGAKQKARGANKKFCPFFLGRFVSPEMRKHFKKHIENTLGVEVPSMRNESFARVEIDIIDDHVRGNNVIDMDLEVVVKDPSVFNQIGYKAFFQQKSYGFGNIEVIG